MKIRNASSVNTPLAYLSNQILYPLVQVTTLPPCPCSTSSVQGCETKDTKVVNLCLQVIQRLITAQVGSWRGRGEEEREKGEEERKEKGEEERKAGEEERKQEEQW